MGGGVHPSRQTSPRQTPPQLGRHPTGQTPPPLGQIPTPPPGRPLPNQTATAADGTHPTGMHSCVIFAVELSDINANAFINVLDLAL